MTTLTFPARAVGALAAATLATTLAGLVGPGAALAAEPTPSPWVGPALSSAADPDGAAPDEARDATVIGWTAHESHVAHEPWSDVVVVPATHGRPLELQQRVDGAWVVRRTIAVDAAGTAVVDVELTAHWRQAPGTLWRLHVPARGTLPAITSGIKRVSVIWHAATDPADPTVLVTKTLGVEPPRWRPAELVTPDLATLGERVRLQPEAAEALAALAAASEKATGHRLVLVSGFRSAGYQEQLFDRYADQHGERGADRFSARAGHSEHQTGWAADVTQQGVPFTDFGGTPSSDWVAANAWRHGFVVRYPAGAEETTGYDAEPWHLRYVGKDLAAYLTATGLTLDDALDHP